MEAMVRLLQFYLGWHYREGIRGYLALWWTLLRAAFHFFSFPFLLRTLFQPLMRLQEEYGEGFDPSRWAQAFIINTVMRAIGFLSRAGLLVVGLVVLLLLGVAGALGFVLWLMWPMLLSALIVGGFALVGLGLRSWGVAAG